jgi:hypothetical protein
MPIIINYRGNAMAEFCENCPMRGTVTGEVVGILSGELNYKTFGGERYNGEAGVLVGANNGASEAIALPSTEAMQARVYEKIDACTSPDMKEKGIFKKREVPVHCPAIGNLALQHPQIKQYFRQLANRELLP